MSDRVHDALDGNLSLDDLSPAEREMARGLQSAIDAAAGQVVREPTPDLTDAVMRRLARKPRHALAPASTSGSGHAGARGGWLRLLWEPRRVMFRPVWALTAAAGIAALVLAPSLALRAPSHSATDPVVGEAADARMTVFVQFRLHAPEASEVRLAGSFTAWEPRYRLHDAGDGTWTLLVPLEPGIHDYAFILDGVTWVPDPSAPRVDDGFGGENSRLALLPGNGVRES